MKERKKEREIVQAIEDARLDVCGMTETNLKGSCVREWEYGMGMRGQRKEFVSL